MKKYFFILLVLFVAGTTQAQILEPVKWSYASKRISNTEAVVLIKATLDKGWHVYSQNVPDGGPVATSISFAPSKSFTLVGKTIEPKPITKFEKVFKMNVSYFDNSVVFQQRIKIKAGQPLVKGTVEFMACNDEQCLPPDEVSFSIPVK